MSILSFLTFVIYLLPSSNLTRRLYILLIFSKTQLLISFYFFLFFFSPHFISFFCSLWIYFILFLAMPTAWEDCPLYQGQELNLHHSCNQSHSSDNARSLTRATRELLLLYSFSTQFKAETQINDLSLFFSNISI